MSLRTRFEERRALRSRVQRQHERLADLERELVRLSPQVAALEERLETLARTLEPGPSATPEQTVEARGLLDAVRREHAQVRARISAATVFEERLRVLEERLAIDSVTGRPVDDRGA